MYISYCCQQFFSTIFHWNIIQTDKYLACYAKAVHAGFHVMSLLLFDFNQNLNVLINFSQILQYEISQKKTC